MRPAGRGPRDSLYFRYPSFAAKDVPKLHGPGAQHRAVIVGVGPIGMTAALILARHGVPSVLLDSKDTFNDGSRAICISRSSVHILERAGAVKPFFDKALGGTHGRSYYRGTQIYRLEMPHAASEKYLPMYNLQPSVVPFLSPLATPAPPCLCTCSPTTSGALTINCMKAKALTRLCAKTTSAGACGPFLMTSGMAARGRWSGGASTQSDSSVIVTSAAGVVGSGANDAAPRSDAPAGRAPQRPLPVLEARDRMAARQQTAIVAPDLGGRVA